MLSKEVLIALGVVGVSFGVLGVYYLRRNLPRAGRSPSPLMHIVSQHTSSAPEAARIIESTLWDTEPYSYLQRQLTDPNVDCDLKEVVRSVVAREGGINDSRLQAALQCIYNATCSIHIVEKMRSTAYSSSSSHHEESLMQLWTLVRGSTTPGAAPRKGSHWTEIGFQGSDPATDFRGGGYLALINMVYFAATQPKVACAQIQDSQGDGEMCFYLWAVVCINFTCELCALHKRRRLNKFFYAISPESVAVISTEKVIEVFNSLFVEVMVFYHKCWLTERPNVMEFNTFKEKVLQKWCEEQGI